MRQSAKRLFHRMVPILLALLVQGCGAGWHQVATPERLAPRQQVQVWHQGEAQRWHALQVRADSVSGIPYHRSIDCDSCRVVWPRAIVDSIRVGNPVAGFWKTVGLVIGIMTGGLIAYCWEGCYAD